MKIIVLGIIERQWDRSPPPLPLYKSSELFLVDCFYFVPSRLNNYMETNHVRPTKLCTKCNCRIANNNIKIHFERCNGTPSHAVRKSNKLPINPNYNNDTYKSNLAALDWKEIQAYYDDNHTFRDVQEQYNLSSIRLARYIKEGYLKTRSSTETLKLRGTRKTPTMTPEMREKVSKGMRKAVLEGRQRTPRPYASRLIIYNHISWLGNEEVLHGGWELKVAKYMDEHKIHYCKSKEHFTYIFEGREHEYFPDFYLQKYDLFIEVKGQVMPKDLEKWKQFPKKLLIIDQKTIKRLEEFFSDLPTK
jgi:hypothetical protein